MEMMQFDAIENKQENPCHLPMDKGFAQILRYLNFLTDFYGVNIRSGKVNIFLEKQQCGTTTRSQEIARASYGEEQVEITTDS